MTLLAKKTRNQQRSIMTFQDPGLLNANFYTIPDTSIEYASTGTGVYDKLSSLVMAKVDSSSPYPDIQISIGAAGTSTADAYGQTLSVVVFLNLNQYANGTLNLTSSNPLAPTSFNANTFVVQQDANLVAKGFIEARKIMAKFSSTVYEVAPGPSIADEQDLVTWIRANPSTACHYYGSAPMGTTSSSPCDVRMRVRGVQGLRLVGPIVVPGQVVVGMQALATALGEKGTDLIIEDWGL